MKNIYLLTGKSEREKRRKIRHKRDRLQADQAFLDTCQDLLDARTKCWEVLTDTPKPKTRTEKEVDRKKQDMMVDLQKMIPTVRKRMKYVERLTQLTSDTRSQTVLLPEKKRWWETFLFYGFLIGVLFVVSLLLGGQSSSGPPRNVMGYSPMTVLTRSMQRVYPKNSLIVTQVTDPKKLKIADDITYLKENNTTVTHRIVAITEDYMGTGARGFETKGTENPESDEEIVRADNVVGKVIFSSFMMGQLIIFIREHLVLTAVIGCLLFYLIDLLIKYIAIIRQSSNGRNKKRRNAMNKKKK